MFKNLRNRLLITNMIIIVALVMVCLGAIRVMSSTLVNRNIDQRLIRKMNGYRSYLELLQSEGGLPGGLEGLSELSDGRLPPDMDIAVLVDKNGEVDESIKDPISVIELSKLDEVAAQFGEAIDYKETFRHIAASSKEKGNEVICDESWEYLRSEFDDGYIIVMTKNELERSMLRTLSIMLFASCVFAVGISFLIGLYTANRTIKPIEDAYNKQKEFVADASHELRTPLASIRANTDVLMSRKESTIAEEYKWLEYIKDEATRMTKLTNDLLFLARIDEDDGDKVYPEISFSEVVDDVLLENEAIAFENGILMEAVVSEDIKITAPPEALKQLVLILVDNAIKYTPNGGNIRVTLKRELDKTVFMVENDGEITEENMARLFERFYRADKSRSRESGGYGLGLAIAKSITVSLGGRIKVGSERGRTRFTVEV